MNCYQFTVAVSKAFFHYKSIEINQALPPSFYSLLTISSLTFGSYFLAAAGYASV